MENLARIEEDFILRDYIIKCYKNPCHSIGKGKVIGIGTKLNGIDFLE
jgi:hypothetical protein